MNRQSLLLLITLFLFATPAFSLTKMHVHDPHGTWREYPATIEEVSISVKPKGLFSEVGLYLTISERGNSYNYNDGDSLEIVLDFELPKEAVVNDLWLWVYGHIIQGKIMDKWTAGKIYDGIVAQKKDPSIIYKQSDTQYQIRIYPMSRGESRKIKLSYLIPNSVIGKDMMVELPGMELIKQSRYMPSFAKVILKASPEGTFPKIVGGANTPLTLKDTLYGDYQAENVSLTNLAKLPAIRIPDVMKNGYYLTTFNDETGENYYQLTAIPNKTQNLTRKILFLVDYESGKSDITKGALLEALRQNILTAGVKDSIAILFSGITASALSDQWTYGAECPVIPAEKVNDYSNLTSLFSAASKFSDATDIVLISANHSFGHNTTANSLIDDVFNLVGKETPIHVIDLCSSYFVNNYFAGRYYRNNEYLYINLTQQSKANFINRCTDRRSISEQLTDIINKSGAILKDFTLKSGLSSGWTYSEYDSKKGGQLTYASDITTQIGKFKGSGSFEIETFFSLDGIIQQESVVIPQDKIPATDSTLKQYWYGHLIYEMEQETADNATVAQIIEASTENRVLSRYTSFLCLEPSDTVPVCDDCFDESDLDTPIMDEKLSENSALFATQAMNGLLKVQFTLPKEFTGKSLTMTLYNLRGQVVRTIELADIKAGLNNMSFDISGANALASGTYILTLRGEGFAKQSKFQIK